MRSEKTKNRAKGMRVKSSIKAGECGQNGNGLMGWCHNHNQTLAGGLGIKSGIKAGPQIVLKPQP